MGHFHEKYIGKGQNRADAERDTKESFWNYEGQHANLVEVEDGTLLRTEPPTQQVTTWHLGYHDGHGRWHPGGGSTISVEPNADAPKEEWVEVWEFTLHYRA